MQCFIANIRSQGPRQRAEVGFYDAGVNHTFSVTWIDPEMKEKRFQQLRAAIATHLGCGAHEVAIAEDYGAHGSA